MAVKQKQRTTRRPTTTTSRPKPGVKAKSKSKPTLRFSVVVEFVVGLIGIFGIGRLLAGRTKEARWFLIASLLLIVPLDFTPRLIGDQYALWAPWLVKAILGFLSAVHLNYVLDRA